MSQLRVRGHAWENLAGLGIVLAMSCMGSDAQKPQRIPMAPNQWGIVALEIDHSETSGDRTFELHGLDASDQDVANLRLHVGTIPDLGNHFSHGDTLPNRGSEIFESWRGVVVDRVVSREMERFNLHVNQLELQLFFATPVVSAELAGAHIFITSPNGVPTPGLPAAALPMTERSYGDLNYGGASCDPSILNTSPLAHDCCWDNGWQFEYCDIYQCYYSQGDPMMMFINESTGDVVDRTYNGSGYYQTGCTASDGQSPCAGSACYYGPNGFTKAAAGYPADSIGFLVTEQVEDGSTMYACQPDGGNNAYIGDVTGTIPLGGGCCINGTGPCGIPGYPACGTCGGGDDGYWDP